MTALASGLPEVVADEEDLARFLSSRSLFTASLVKPPAFLPSPKDDLTSVFRHGAEPRDNLWQIGQTVVPTDRTLYGAAVLTAKAVRDASLDVCAEEPPPRHAKISGWPNVADDPEEEKAQRKELSLLLAQASNLILR